MHKFMEKLLEGATVERKRLEEVFEINAGGDVPKNALSKIKTDEYNIPILSNGINEKALYGWTNKAKINKPSLTISARGTIGWTSYRESPFYPIVRLLVLTPKIKLNLKYAYYYMKTIENSYKSSKSGIPQLTKPMITKIQIPIPPLEVQREIVRILDNFTELTAELTAELSARRKQYSYYRDRLLDFSDEDLGFRIEWRKLGEVAKYEQPTKYLVKSKEYSDKYDTPVLTAGKTFILGYTNETEGIYKASESPVIIFDDFTTANKWVDFDFKVKSSAMKMITSVDENRFLLKYIYYWLNTLPSGLVEGDHKRQWISNFSNKKIPIPPLEKQKEIVAILDKFDTLTNSISEGLPHEIELRQKQYEYYRDLLLNFPKEENCA